MASNHLFELIHSLSPTEKGYIKKMAFAPSKGDENSYIKLFDAIAAQEEYNEDKIIKKFRNEAFIKNISKSKNHLYNLILKRLTQYHEENLIEIKIKSILNQSVILYKKGLHEQALNNYERALKLALENEELQTANEIYSKMLDIYFIGKMGVKFPYQKEYLELAEKLRKQEKIIDINIDLAEIMFADNFVKEEKSIQQINLLVSHPSLKEIDENDSFLARWGKLCALSQGYYLMGEFKKDEEVKLKQMELLRADTTVNRNNPMRFVKHLVNLINVKINVSDYNAIPPLLKELKNFKSAENLCEHIEPLQRSTYYIHSLTYFCQTNQFEKAEDILEEAILWFEANDKLISDYFKIIFYDMVFLVYFTQGELKKCIPWLNNMVHLKSAFRIEFQLSIKFYQLILHFELKNFELIAYQIKSIYRELLKLNHNQETGKYILRWFQSNLKEIHNGKNLADAASEIKGRLKVMTTTGDWKLLTEMSVFKAWINSKINKNSFRENYAELFSMEVVEM